MANHRLVALVTALLMLGGSRVGAEVDLESLRAMNEMIDNQRWGELRDYIVEHPEVLAGEDALSEELRNFVFVTARAGNRAYGATTRSLVAEAPPSAAESTTLASEGELY